MVVTDEEIRVQVPYCPRNWAQRLHDSLARYAVLVLHRRAGKTTAILNHHQRAALDDNWERQRLLTILPHLTKQQLKDLMKRRVYWHVIPTFHQAKLTGAWDTVKEISRDIPGVKHNQAEMLCTYPNGSKLQLIGADNPDSLRGPALSGLSLDEYSQIPPNAYGEVLSKALADHVGYCIFSGTIKGFDQLWKIYDEQKKNPEWFSLWQDIDKSLATEEGATIEALRTALQDDRKQVLQGLMTQAQFDQEWYLSAEAAIQGAFFGPMIQQARKENRIGRVPYDPGMPVDTDWDLGIDAMAIWFSQTMRTGEVRLVDYYENIGGGMPEAIKAIKERPYIYGEHRAPHDIEIREISSGTTRRQIAYQMGINFLVTPKISVEDGITAAQLLIPRCYFDEAKCKHGINALTHYRRTYQQKLDIFTEKPVHDRWSHGADAFRGLAVNHKPFTPPQNNNWRSPRAVSAWT